MTEIVNEGRQTKLRHELPTEKSSFSFVEGPRDSESNGELMCVYVIIIDLSFSLYWITLKLVQSTYSSRENVNCWINYIVQSDIIGFCDQKKGRKIIVDYNEDGI